MRLTTNARVIEPRAGGGTLSALKLAGGGDTPTIPHTAIDGTWGPTVTSPDGRWRSEEHTSELQSQSNLVCRLLLEKKKKNTSRRMHYKGSSMCSQQDGRAGVSVMSTLCFA